MRWFTAVVGVVADSTRATRYPLHSTATRRFARLFVDRFDGADLPALLAAETGRDYGNDAAAAVREYTAGAVLACLVDASPHQWMAAAFAAGERLLADTSTWVGRRSDGANFLLGLALLSGDRQRITGAAQARRQLPPSISVVESTVAHLLLAEAEAVLDGGVHEIPDLIPITAMAFPGHSVPLLALALARYGPDGVRASFHRATDILNDDLTTADDMLRIVRTKSYWHLVRRSRSIHVELEAWARGDGGVVHAAPWALPMDILSPWTRLNELCRGEAEFVGPGARSQQRIATMLRDDVGEIRIVGHCEGNFELDPAGVSAIRNRLPVGIRWLQTLHPWLRAKLTWEVTQKLDRSAVR
jgi:hypothetical protein